MDRGAAGGTYRSSTQARIYRVATLLRSASPDAAIPRPAFVAELRARLERELRPPLPENLPLVMADPARAVQILTNLLVNSLRYTPAPGHVEVTVSSAADMVAFRVTDTGVGLTPEQLAHIFERFYRADKSRSRALGGSGIGLTIAQSLAQAMGGDIRVESAGLGQGSSFTLTLPQARE